MSDIDQSLEQLLSEASPRPVPHSADMSAARDAVRAEWQAVSGKHRSRRRMLRFAVAATVLIGVFSIFNQFRAPELNIIRVAAIQKSVGSIYVLGEQSELTLAGDLKAIHVGQTIVTGNDATIALAWGRGGSLRLDNNTQVEFRDDDSVYLKSGRIYFDSMPSELSAGISGGGIAFFEIETDFGLVSHVGTQFMTQVEAGELKVSVREGQVDVAGEFFDYRAESGEQVRFMGSQRPMVGNFPEYGPAWDWIGISSPSINLSGKSVYEFLEWAGRELGREIVFSTAAIEQEVKTVKLVGDINTAPADALRLRMATTDIEWRFEEGAIYVGKRE